MQRILSRGEIENLDHTLIPRVRQPELASVFADRAARMRSLASQSPLQAYLQMMAHVSDAQQQVVAGCDPLPGADESRLSLAQSHGMPPLQAVGWPRDPAWRDMLHDILMHVLDADGVPDPAVNVCRMLAECLVKEPELIEQQADAVLANLDDVDGASAPFIMAGLQAYWTVLAAQFDQDQLPVVLPFGVCPVCGMQPVSSIVKVGAQIDGCRYLCCSLCSTEWHLVRVTCSHCEDTEKIWFYSIEDGSDAIKAESCGKCHTYRKVFYQNKDPHVDAVADDLATLALDIMMSEEGFARASGNPLLWQKKES